MAVAVYFHPQGLTVDKLNEIERRLDDAGQAVPAGILHHSVFGEDGSLMVYDIWETRDAFDAFASALLPIIREVGLDPGQPDVMPVQTMFQKATE
jgi:hypothetical protein